MELVLNMRMLNIESQTKAISDDCGRPEPLFHMPGMQIASTPAGSSLLAVALCNRAWGGQHPLLSCNSGCAASCHLLLPRRLLQPRWVFCKLPLLWGICFARGGDEGALGKQAWRLLPAKLEAPLKPTLKVHCTWYSQFVFTCMKTFTGAMLQFSGDGVF